LGRGGRPLPQLRLGELCPLKSAVLRMDSIKGQNAHPERAGEEKHPHWGWSALSPLWSSLWDRGPPLPRVRVCLKVLVRCSGSVPASASGRAASRLWRRGGGSCGHGLHLHSPLLLEPVETQECSGFPRATT
jgi:hypothetical protein